MGNSKQSRGILIIVERSLAYALARLFRPLDIAWDSWQVVRLLQHYSRAYRSDLFFVLDPGSGKWTRHVLMLSIRGYRKLRSRNCSFSNQLYLRLPLTLRAPALHSAHEHHN